MSDLSEYAQNPKTVVVDGVTVTRHSPTALIEVERHEAAKEATASPAQALKGMILQIVPPGGSS
jgi:hypothetical protein